MLIDLPFEMHVSIAAIVYLVTIILLLLFFFRFKFITLMSNAWIIFPKENENKNSIELAGESKCC